MKKWSNFDYIDFYVQKMNEDPVNYFEQHKEFINAQIKGSNSLFSNMFKDGDFKIQAREYLRNRGILK